MIGDVPTRPRLFVLAAAAFLALAACADASGGSASDRDASPSSMAGHGEMGEGSVTFGEPGDPDAADRIIKIAALDTLSFQPKEISVATGEIVLFEVTNDGKLAHEFVIGDDATQDEHEMEMADMGQGMMPADEANAVGLEPGETKMLAWTFSEPGTFKYGCHVTGHYAGGMVGTITVSG
jgi:uncharacterized cupredoxin-like copper-binding protein